jgi:hypothetical protein
MTSPTQRTLADMRARGYFCWVVEHWNSFTKRRVDLWGFADVLALGDDEVVAVQTTSWTNVPARIRKITDHENVAAVRKAGVRIIVQGWRKGKNGRWEKRETDIS